MLNAIAAIAAGMALIVGGLWFTERLHVHKWDPRRLATPWFNWTLQELGCLPVIIFGLVILIAGLHTLACDLFGVPGLCPG